MRRFIEIRIGRIRIVRTHIIPLRLRTLAVFVKTIDQQSVQCAFEEIGTLVAYHVKVARVVECELAGPLAKNLLDKSILVKKQVLIWIAFDDTAKSDTGPHFIYIFDGRRQVSGLGAGFSIAEIQLAEAQPYPLRESALEGISGIILQETISGTVMRSLVDGLHSCSGSADPKLIVGTACPAVTPVDGLTGSVNRNSLIKTRITCIDNILKHLLAFHFFSSYEHVVQFSRSLGLIPVERSTVGPGEHLHILLSRTVAETLVRPEVEPAVVVSVGRLRHTDSHDHLRAALEKI